MVTIKKVAEIAQVSTATVSRVMNGSKPVSDLVKKKVWDAIEETGFKPNSVARSLILKKSNMIGVIITDIATRYFGELVKGIETTANSYGYNIILGSSNYDEKKEIDYLKLMENKQVDGIIFATRSIRDSHREFIKSTKIPVLCVSREFKGISSVRVDNYNESIKAVEYLISLGHKDIAMICGFLEDEASGKERVEGYKQALLNSGISYKESMVSEGDFSIKSGYSAMGKLLKSNNKITAIFAASDEMAYGAINYLFDQNYSVPDDFSIIGFDDIDYSNFVRPRLTTIHQPIYKTGEKAATVMMKLIDGEEALGTDYVLDAELIVRNSTKKL